MNIVKILILSLLLLFIPGIVSAQSITLYDQPNQNAKVIGTADLSAGVISIFSPSNNSDWMKVGDPRNGNVGWVKTSDLKNVKGSESIVTQKVLTNNPSTSVQVLQVGDGPKLTKEQAQVLLREYQAKQIELQKTLQGVIGNMNDFIKNEINYMNIQTGVAIPPGSTSKPATTPQPTTQTQPAQPKQN